MKTDTFNFLEALTFAAVDESPILDASPHDFHPDVVSAVGRFCTAFRGYCLKMGLPDPNTLERSFGGNVYFSLSGHGCGFWDDSGPWGDVLHAALVRFSGDNGPCSRFEGLADILDYQENGKIHLSLIPAALPTYMENYFGVPDVSALPDISGYLVIACCPAKADLRVVPSGPFTAPPYWEGEAWTLQPFTVAEFEARLDTLNAG